MERMIEPDGKLVIVLATALLLGCVIAGIGFVLGRDSSEPAQAQSVARAAQSERITAIRKAAYKHGFADGRKAAERNAGRDRSATSDRDALSANGFELEPGSYYVVQVGGDSKISEYAPMQAGGSYQLCDAYGVCVSGR